MSVVATEFPAGGRRSEGPPTSPRVVVVCPEEARVVHPSENPREPGVGPWAILDLPTILAPAEALAVCWACPVCHSNGFMI